MISEDHFVWSKDREVSFILVRAMRIVPYAACTGNHEDTSSLDESIAPQGAKQEDVEFNQSLVFKITNRGEDIPTLPTKRSSRHQVQHSNQADSPHRQVDSSLDNGHKNNSTSMSNKLSSSLAHSHSQSDSTATTKKKQEEQSWQSEWCVSQYLVSCLSSSIDSWNRHESWSSIRGCDHSSIVKEDESSKSKAYDNSNSRGPDNQSSQTLESVHEDKRDQDSNSKSTKNPFPVLNRRKFTFSRSVMKELNPFWDKYVLNVDT